MLCGRCCSQGSKRMQLVKANKAERAAKQSKDKKPKGSTRDPALPTSVPLPAHVEDISDAGMRAMWEQEQAIDGEREAAWQPLALQLCMLSS